MLIAIDAGHGPNTPGKRTPDGKMREYAFNASVADEVCRALHGWCMTLRVDEPAIDVSLAARVQKANDARATCYVSIHANAHGTEWNDAHGIETYVSTETTIALRQGSKQLAETVHRQLIAHTKRKDRGVKNGDFYVLRKTQMPACLIECGFMTHEAEAILLQSPAYRQKCAQAIVAALKEVYALTPPSNPTNNNPSPQSQSGSPQWAIDARNWAMAQGLTDGENPKEAVKREQMWEMLRRFAQSLNNS